MGRFELLHADRSIVVVIDQQGKLMQRAWRSRLVLDATVRLLKIADLFQVPVLLTEQYPEGLGPTHPDIRTAFDGLETRTGFMKKVAFGCCGDAKFEDELASLRPGLPPERRQVVVAGIEAHVCVLQTVVELLGSGHQVHLCWDCVSGRGEEYRRHALQRMQQAGAQLTNHESVGFEWARSKEHAAFQGLNALLREGQLT